LIRDAFGRYRIFDEATYLRDNPGLADELRRGGFPTAQAHFVKRGQYENLQGVPLLDAVFDEKYYLKVNPDVAAAVAAGRLRSGRAHFIEHGHREGRRPASAPVHYQGFAIPEELVNMSGAGPSVFGVIAEDQLREVQARIGVPAGCLFVEVGCGVGRMAMPLTRVLTPADRYLGFDIDKSLIDWARDNISARFPHFQFQHLDVWEEALNPDGRLSVADIRFPVADASVDRIVLWSVFTHLLRPEVQHYLREFRRILKDDGLIFATCFVLSPHVLAKARADAPTIFQLGFRHPPEHGCFVNDPAAPRMAVGYTPEALEEMVAAAGLRFTRPFVRGAWSGRHPDPESAQDGMVLARAGGAARG
jgi:SAM-dependent methyltransferase